jgi:phosphoribosylaminoimidazole-succinocarboxamide synthase
MGKEGQTVPAMSEEWIQTISKRYIELYEQIIGEAFKPESKSEAETFQLIQNALNNLGIK